MFFSYFRDTTADQARGEVVRVFPESRMAYLLALKDGTSLACKEAEGIESARMRGEEEGLKFTYVETTFKEWWTESVTDEQKKEWTDGIPEEEATFHTDTEEGVLVCSLETGEPMTFDEAVESGMIDPEAVHAEGEGNDEESEDEDFDDDFLDDDELPEEEDVDGEEEETKA